MRHFGTLAFVFILAAAFAVPVAAQAIGMSFGGRVIAIKPCTGGIQIAIAPAGRFQPLYVWSAATIGLPPFRIGQYILGIADLPLVLGTCAGQRIQRDGVGL